MISIKRGLLALGFTLLAALPATSSQAAAVCGDDVDGTRVACECGSIVVSDTTLRIDDPIVLKRCESNGLLVRASSEAKSIHLDLAGLSLQGSGAGTGIRVLRGGSQGAVIVGGPSVGAGQVVGFRTGISARGTSALAELRNVRVESNSRIGVAVESHSAILVGVVALSNGGDGAHIGGRNIDARGLESYSNKGAGIALSGSGHSVHGRSADNGTAAVTQRGRTELQSVEVSR